MIVPWNVYPAPDYSVKQQLSIYLFEIVQYVVLCAKMYGAEEKLQSYINVIRICFWTVPIFTIEYSKEREKSSDKHLLVLVEQADPTGSLM